MIYLSRPYNSGTMVIRDFKPKDIEPILDYWYGMTEKELYTIGVRPELLPSREERRIFFEKKLGNNLLINNEFMFVLAHDDEIVGYYLINNIQHGDSCQHHAHVVKKEYRGNRVVVPLIVDLMKLVFSLGDVNTIIAEPNRENPTVNAIFRRYGLVPKRSYYKDPQGICRAMTVNRYEIQMSEVNALSRLR